MDENRAPNKGMRPSHQNSLRKWHLLQHLKSGLQGEGLRGMGRGGGPSRQREQNGRHLFWRGLPEAEWLQGWWNGRRPTSGELRQQEEGTLAEKAGISWGIRDMAIFRILVFILRAMMNCFWLSTGVKRFVFSKWQLWWTIVKNRMASSEYVPDFTPLHSSYGRLVLNI